MKKVIKRILIAIAALLAVAIAAVLIIFNRELRTVNSIEKVTDNFYSMDYKADYGLDEFLEQGASTDKELAEFVIKKLMKGIPVNIELPDFGCSTFNAQTPDGDYIFGRNFDNPDAVYTIVHTDPKDGYESISMVNLSYIGYGEDYLPDNFKDSILALAAPYIPLDGINEKGLSIGVLQLSTDVTNQETDKVDITTTSAIRMILDKAATVDEALALLEQYDMHSSANAPYHFQIADAYGNSVTVEYLDNVMYVYKEEDSTLVTTNFVLTEGEYFNHGSGQNRYEIIEAGLEEKNGVVTEEEAMDLLEAASQYVANGKGSSASTLWSCVYNNTDKTLSLCCNQNYEKVYTYSVDWD